MGPTCDSLDQLPDGVPLPVECTVGDYLLFEGLGAYSLAMSTRFNGYGLSELVTVQSLVPRISDERSGQGGRVGVTSCSKRTSGPHVWIARRRRWGMTTQAMQKFGKSQPVTRREDQRFLTGRGTYIEDSFPVGALRAFVLRSPVAHGVVTHLDVAEARRAPGVAGVLTQGDLEGGMDAFMDSLVVDQLDGTPGARPARPMLAKDRVRFVGEAVAVVFADSLSQARDAAERIVLDIEDLAVKLDLAPGGVALHEGVTDNTAFDWGIGDRDATDAAFAAADHVVSLEVPDSRVIINTMEPRGCHATWDGSRLHFAYSGAGGLVDERPFGGQAGTGRRRCACDHSGCRRGLWHEGDALS